MGAVEVEAFLTHLAVERNVSASTQNQALGGLLFLDRQLLDRDRPLIHAVRAKTPERLPVVLSLDEVRRILEHIPPDANRLMIELMYGTDMRTVQELLGHADVSTTQIYTHVLQRGA